MTCTLELTDPQRQWFDAHKDAWAIVNGGADDLRPTNSPHGNMVALLSNMADFGRRTWKYEPGNTTHVGNTLKGLHDVTDCGALADMFQQMAMNLGFTDAKTWHIKPEDAKDRIVTGPDLMCFTGQAGDPGIDGRWCFGDHWVVRCGSKSYDPTFNRYFDTAPLPPYFGWWGRYVYDKTVFATHYFACEDQPAIYNGFVAGTPSRAFRPAIKGRAGFCGIGRRAARPAQPAVAATPGKMFYTYRKTDRAGKEIG
jgi:hypothetical protein